MCALPTIVSYLLTEDVRHKDLLGLLAEAGLGKELAELVGGFLKCEECVQSKTKPEELEEINCLGDECVTCNKSVCWDCSYAIPREVRLPGGSRYFKEIRCSSCVEALFRVPDEESQASGEPDFYDSDNEPHWL